MMPDSIRVRLTLWYFGIVAVTFATYVIGILLAMRASVNAVLDEELRSRLVGVQRFMNRYDPRVSLEHMQEEFREHAGLRPGGDLLQVSDEPGRWLFRSASIESYHIRTPSLSLSAPRYETLDAAGERLRVLSANVTVSGNIYAVQLAAPVAEAHRILRRFQWLLLTSTPLALAIASLGGYWMSRRALAPVDAITHAAQTVSEHNLSARLAIPQTADELQRLTVTFNQMLGRLETSFKRITQFTADASHELRTPVAIVRTTAELSLRRDRDAPEYQDALNQILEEATRMTAIIESLMAMARVDSGAEVLKNERVDVAALLRNTCVRSEPLARLKHVQFERDVPDTTILRGDPTMLQRLFLSLIDNAIKYTPSGGRVHVGLNTEADDIMVTVQDTGIGIAKEDLPFVFDRFYRADKVRSREVGGAGLGLSIARWIAEAHHGSIRAESTLGQGSVFEIRIPRSNVGGSEAGSEVSV